MGSPPQTRPFLKREGLKNYQELLASDVELSSTMADINDDGVPDFAVFRGRTVDLTLLVSTP